MALQLCAMCRDVTVCVTQTELRFKTKQQQVSVPLADLQQAALVCGVYAPMGTDAFRKTWDVLILQLKNGASAAWGKQHLEMLVLHSSVPRADAVPAVGPADDNVQASPPHVQV